MPLFVDGQNNQYDFPPDATQGEIMSILGQIGQEIATPIEGSSLPDWGAKDVYGVSPQQLSVMTGQVQEDAFAKMRRRLIERQMLQDALENEKNRQHAIKLEQQRMQNDLARDKIAQDAAIKREQLRQKAAEAKAKLEASQPQKIGKGQAIWDPTTGREIYKNQGDESFTLSEGAARFDAEGNIIAQRPKTYAPQRGGTPKPVPLSDAEGKPYLLWPDGTVTEPGLPGSFKPKPLGPYGPDTEGDLTEEQKQVLSMGRNRETGMVTPENLRSAQGAVDWVKKRPASWQREPGTRGGQAQQSPLPPRPPRQPQPKPLPPPNERVVGEWYISPVTGKSGRMRPDGSFDVWD